MTTPAQKIQDLFERFRNLTGDPLAASNLALATVIAGDSLAPEMLDIKQAAQVIGYSVRGLRKLVAQRAIQFAQNGPHAPIKFRRLWLDEFIEQGSLRAPDSKPRRTAKRLPVVSGNHGFDASLLN